MNIGLYHEQDDTFIIEGIEKSKAAVKSNEIDYSKCLKYIEKFNTDDFRENFNINLNLFDELEKEVKQRISHESEVFICGKVSAPSQLVQVAEETKDSNANQTATICNYSF